MIKIITKAVVASFLSCGVLGFVSLDHATGDPPARTHFSVTVSAGDCPMPSCPEGYEMDPYCQAIACSQYKGALKQAYSKHARAVSQCVQIAESTAANCYAIYLPGSAGLASCLAGVSSSSNKCNNAADRNFYTDTARAWASYLAAVKQCCIPVEPLPSASISKSTGG